MDDTQNQVPGVPQPNPASEPVQPGAYTPPAEPVVPVAPEPQAPVEPAVPPMQEPTVVPSQEPQVPPVTPPVGGLDQGGTQGTA